MAQMPARLHLGRSALLVHGIMYLAIGVSVSLVLWSTDDDRALGVPLAAAFALFCWSMILAVRALVAGEKSFWPAFVVSLGLLEIGGSFAWVATQRYSSIEAVQWAYSFGLPMVVPAFTLAILIAAAIARWRTLRVERAATSGGSAEWDRQRRWKYGLCWFVPIAILIFTLLFPGPLYVFALLNYKYYGLTGKNRDWDNWVIEHTPVVVADSTASFFSATANPTSLEIYCLALRSGRVSRRRLMAELNSTSPWQPVSALEGLEKIDPAAAVVEAERLALCATPVYLTEISAAPLVARHGSAEEIRKLLGMVEKAKATSAFFDVLLQDLIAAESYKFVPPRREFVPDYIRLVESNTPYRQTVLDALSRGGPPAELEPVWLRWMDDPVTTRAAEVVASITNFPDLNAQFRLLGAGLRHAGAHVRTAALRSLQFSVLSAIMPVNSQSQVSGHSKLIMQIVRLLDDNDLEVRRWATLILAFQLRQPFMSGSPTTGNIQPPTVAELQREIDERKAIRGYAEKWLSDHAERTAARE